MKEITLGIAKVCSNSMFYR